jgi:hypothetical protein
MRGTAKASLLRSWCDGRGRSALVVAVRCMLLALLLTVGTGISGSQREETLDRPFNMWLLSEIRVREFMQALAQRAEYEIRFDEGVGDPLLDFTASRRGAPAGAAAIIPLKARIGFVPVKYTMSWVVYLCGLSATVEDRTIRVMKGPCEAEAGMLRFHEEQEGAWLAPITNKLAERISITAREMPLDDFVLAVAASRDVPVLVDPRLYAGAPMPCLDIGVTNRVAWEALVATCQKAGMRVILRGGLLFLTSDRERQWE